MYKHNQKQIEFSDFYLPFGGKLSGDNRWVKLAQLIPWSDLEEYYASNFSSNNMGAPAKSMRMAIGALIIKEKLQTSDEETVEQIIENPYLQFFLGLHEYSYKAPFEASMFVHFRKRFDLKKIMKINDLTVAKAVSQRKPKDKKNDKDDDSSSGDGCSQNPPKSNNIEPPKQGKLLVDATCVPADISFPTDLKLLNKAREISEEIIDKLHKPQHGKKPRTYRKEARRNFLNASKSKKLSSQKRHFAIRAQLQYLKRNLNHIDIQKDKISLSELGKALYRKLLIIKEVYRQQKELLQSGSRSIKHRIVSISQPHVRAIVRGKASATTEFGAKISASVVEGYTFLDRLSWENYNESEDLEIQIEQYRQRFGYYPESVHADKIYRTRKNREYCKQLGIRMSGAPLGRPPKDVEKNIERKKIERQDEIDRIPVEGKFGQGKRRYSLGRIMAKLATTSECAIGIVFFVMNLERWLKEQLSWLSILFEKYPKKQKTILQNICIITKKLFFKIHTHFLDEDYA